MENLESLVIPWHEAELVLKEAKPILKSSPSAYAFLVALALLVLNEPSVKLDIQKRIKSGSGERMSCCHSHSHNSACISFLDSLILETTSPESLQLLTASIVANGSKTFQNVLQRGVAAGDTSMDKKTEKFVRAKIFTESLVREIVKAVKQGHADAQAKLSVDGSLFALTSSDDVELNAVSSTAMADLMSKGVCVIDNFISDDVRETVERDLVRMDALGKFESVAGRTDLVCWIRSDDLNLQPATKSLLEKIALIPYELNRRNKALMLQVVQFFQCSSFPARNGQQCMHADSKVSKITVIAPISDSGNIVIRTKSGITVSGDSSSLVLMNATEYECPPADKKRFHITAFLTGPPATSN